MIQYKINLQAARQSKPFLPQVAFLDIIITVTTKRICIVLKSWLDLCLTFLCSHWQIHISDFYVVLDSGSWFWFGDLFVIWGLLLYLFVLKTGSCFLLALPWNLLGSWVFELLILLSPPWITGMQHHHRFFFHVLHFVVYVCVWESVCGVHTRMWWCIHLCS